MRDFRGSRIMPAMAVLAMLIPMAVAAQAKHPRSYFPTLTRDDVSVCRTQFAALKADYVASLRQDAANYAPGGKYYNESYADGHNTRVYTKEANRLAATDALSVYVEGVKVEGGGYGDLAAMNEYTDDGSVERYQETVNEPDLVRNPSNLDWVFWSPYSYQQADKCVGRIFLKKFYAMHPERAPGYSAPSVARNQTVTYANPAPGGASTQTAVPTSQATNTDEQAIGLTEDGGRLAVDCVSPEKDKWNRRILVNRCGDKVEVGWCVGAECERNSGNQGTILPGGNRTMSGEGRFLWGACHGANTIHGVSGSKGTRFRCTAP